VPAGSITEVDLADAADAGGECRLTETMFLYPPEFSRSFQVEGGLPALLDDRLIPVVALVKYLHRLIAGPSDGSLRTGFR
jgi:hypothetical protein